MRQYIFVKIADSMATRKYDEYRDKALKPFVEELQNDYYNAIENQCAATRRQVNKIKKLGVSDSSMQYVLLCDEIISETEQHIKNRKGIYIPYVHSLAEKARDNHNCSNCSGNCKINHDVHVIELNATNDEMKKVLSRLQVITLPLYSETIYPEEYRLLRSNMTLIETNLSELFFLENHYLIPNIVEAQKSINAGTN